MLNHKKLFADGEIGQRSGRGRMLWGLACACLIGSAAVAGYAQNPKTGGTTQSGDKATLSASANTVPDAAVKADPGDQKAEQQNGQQNLDAPEAERRKQIADESTQLVALATALKTEVAKTNRDMLSVAVIRKADEIEKLAHNVKDKRKAGGS